MGTCFSHQLERAAIARCKTVAKHPPSRVGETVAFKVTAVTDGDTWVGMYFNDAHDAEVDGGKPLVVALRLMGIDTPEKKCAEGVWIGDQLRPLLVSRVIDVTIHKWDKWGGRIDGTPYVNGINVCHYLVSERLAKPYTGRGKKPKWTDKDLAVIRAHGPIRL